MPTGSVGARREPTAEGRTRREPASNRGSPGRSRPAGSPYEYIPVNWPPVTLITWPWM